MFDHADRLLDFTISQRELFASIGGGGTVKPWPDDAELVDIFNDGGSSRYHRPQIIFRVRHPHFPRVPEGGVVMRVGFCEGGKSR